MQIGAFDLPPVTAAPSLFMIELLLHAQDLQEQWRRCNMVANYVAEYVAYQFPEREWAENLISTVANEFLEAVARLSPASDDVVLRCTQYTNDLLIEIEHGVQQELRAPYTTFLRELCDHATDALYFQLLMAPDRPTLDFNQFGLVMLVHDFQAHIAANLHEAAARMRVRVLVPTREISA